MKKILSILMALVLVLSATTGVFAATLTPSTDKAVIKAGEDVNVTLSLDETIPNITTIAYKLYFNSDLFTVKSGAAGATPGVQKSGVKTNATGSYINISYLDPTSEGVSMNAGVFYTVTFTAKADITENMNSEFSVAFENGMDNTFANTTHEAGAAASVSVKTAASYVSGYGVTMPADKSVVAGEAVAVDIAVSSDSESKYNAFYYTLTYDPAKLTYVGVSAGEATNDAAAGTVTIAGYGADKALAEKVTANFTAAAVGESTITLTAANLDKAANASVQNTPAATILDGTTVVNVTGYPVTLDNDFTGNETATPNADYTFEAKDKNYNYTINATMGTTPVTVNDNGNGTFTIENVTGPLVIETATKVAKTFNVTVNGNGSGDAAAAATATYGTDYSFTVSKDDYFSYNVTAQIGASDITPVLGGDGITYTINGSDITDDITITVAKTAAKSKITFTGEGSSDVVGGTEQPAPIGEAFTFTLNKVEGYDYTVSASKGGANVTVTDNNNGTYTIAGADIDGAAIAVAITKTMALEVEVNEYVKLNGTSIWLVTAKGAPGEGKVYAYDGNAMSYSEKYEAYAYLVISADTLESVKTAATAAIGIATATKSNIVYSGDVNATDAVDVNDAQLVYNMYNAQYENFTAVPMERFLRADVTGDKVLTVQDAAAIVNTVLGK